MINGKTQRFYEQFERYFYVKIIKIPTNLITNSLSTSFCALLVTTNKNHVFSNNKQESSFQQVVSREDKKVTITVIQNDG